MADYFNGFDGDISAFIKDFPVEKKLEFQDAHRIIIKCTNLGYMELTKYIRDRFCAEGGIFFKKTIILYIVTCAQSNHLELMKYWVEKCDELSQQELYVILFRCIPWCNFTIFRYFVDKGVNIFVAPNYECLVMQVLSWGKSEILRYILDNPNHRIDPMLALDRACESGQETCVRILINKFGNRCKNEMAYNTALRKGNKAIIDFLSELEYFREFREKHILEHKEVDTESNSDNTACIICNYNEKKVSLIPCGHYGYCFACSDKLVKCPICNREKKTVQRIYIL